MVETAKKKVNPAAKKVAIVIIVILILAIGSFWYLGGTKSGQALRQGQLTAGLATSSPAINVDQQINLEKIVIASTINNNGDTTTPALDFGTKKYVRSDLIISNNNSTTSLKTYGEKVRLAILPLSNYQPNDASLVLKVLGDKDTTSLKQLALSTVLFGKMERDLKKISVPSGVATLHLALLNQTQITFVVIGNMTNALANPAVALENALIYQKTLSNFYTALGNLNKFFIDKKISFGSGRQVTINPIN